MLELFLVARLALAATFVVAGIAKLNDRSGTSQALANFGVPVHFTSGMAVSLPLAELVTAVLLLPSTTAWWGALAALGMLAVFTAAIAVNLWKGRRPACNCFGQLRTTPVSPLTLVRNGVLALPAMMVALLGHADAGPGAFDWLLRGMSPAESALTVLAAALAAGLAIAVVSIRRLTTEQHRLRESVVVLERLFDAQEAVSRGMSLPPSHTNAAPNTEGVQLPVGALAPDFAVRTMVGGTIHLGDVLSLEKPVLLLFVNRRCGPCHELLPRASEWAHALASRLTVLAIAGGSAEENAEMMRQFPGAPLAFARATPVADHYGATWTPAAVLIDERGRIAEAVTFGADAIRQLVARIEDPPAAEDVAATRELDFVAYQDGSPVSREALLGEHGLAVLFWSASCPFCQELVDDMRAWTKNRPARAPNLMLLARNRERLGDSFGLPALIDEAGVVIDSLKLGGTPTAAFYDRTGRLASFTAVAPFGVRALLGIPPKALPAPAPTP